MGTNRFAWIILFVLLCPPGSYLVLNTVLHSGPFADESVLLGATLLAAAVFSLFLGLEPQRRVRHLRRPAECRRVGNIGSYVVLTDARYTQHRRTQTFDRDPQRRKSVPDCFDIFKIFGTGNHAWLASAPSLDAAVGKIQDFARYLPGTYIVKNQTTGEELKLTPSYK